jgi:hypothetical protein
MFAANAARSACVWDCGEFIQVTKMDIGKVILEKSVDTQMEKAADCFDLAKTQQNMADKQHEIAAAQRENAEQQHDNADLQHEIAAKQSIGADKIDANGNKLEADANKLNTIAQALQTSAVETLGDTMLVQRGCARPPQFAKPIPDNGV